MKKLFFLLAALLTASAMPTTALAEEVYRDSRVRFFNAQWQRLYWLELPAPQTPDFFSASPDSVAREMDFAQRSVDDMRLVEVTASPSEPLLTLNVAVDELAEEEKKVARRYVRPLRYRWTGSEFLRE